MLNEAPRHEGVLV